MREATAPRPPSFASLVQQFFTEYLVAQRALSPRTVTSYRDALMLFLDFTHRHLGKSPTHAALDRHRTRLNPGVPQSSGPAATDTGAHPQPTPTAPPTIH